MTTGMFILRGDGSLKSMSSKPYDSEALLQSWIADHPELLGGDQINPEDPRRWLLIRREAGVPRDPDSGSWWSLDHLFLDQDGIPTFVEVKRSSDIRIRREVVGQMLDYAANGLRYWPLESIQAMFYGRCQAEGVDPDVEIRRSLGPDIDPSDLWSKVANNLEDGSIRLLFVADQIPMELLTVVEFLNKQMSRTEVLAVEIRQFIEDGEGGLVTLTPRVLGQSIESQQKKRQTSSVQRLWNEETFFEEVNQNLDVADALVLRKIYDWSLLNLPRMTFGRGKTMGSFSAALDVPQGAVWPLCVYTQGYIEFQFQFMANQPVFSDMGFRKQFLDKLLLIDDFNPANNDETLRRRPSIKASSLVADGELGKLIEALDWFVAQVNV